MQIRSVVPALLALLLLGTPRMMDAQDAATTAAARQRAAELVRVVGSGDRASARAYVQESFSPDALRRVSVEARLSTISTFHDRTRGLELGDVRPREGGGWMAVVRDRLLGGTWQLLFHLEPSAPYRIERWGMAPGASGEPGPARSEAEVVAQLAEDVRRLCDADVFSGAVLLARGDEVLYQHACGAANKDFSAPNRVDTRFNLGSMNKMVTAVAIAQLVERGNLSFDDPLSKFMPDFPSPEAARKIRIKHLLSHTSGLGSYFTEEFWNASRARFRTVDDYLALAKGDSLRFEPGTAESYSNTGFLVLGKVIEEVSGQSYSDYVREHVYGPAGMSRTGEFELDRVNENLAVGYEKEFTDSGVEFRNNIFAHVIRGGPAGGGYSTVGDLMRFGRALRSGTLLRPETVAILTSPKPELGSPGYGYGFGVSTAEGIVGHSGGFPGVSANLDLYTERGYTAAVLSNYGGGAPAVEGRIRTLLRSVPR